MRSPGIDTNSKLAFLVTPQKQFDTHLKKCSLTVRDRSRTVIRGAQSEANPFVFPDQVVQLDVVQETVLY